MFKPLSGLSRNAEWCGSLSRLNKTLFLMLIDSAGCAVSHGLGKTSVNITSNFIGPNQYMLPACNPCSF